MQEFEKIIPGAAREILDMAKKEQENRLKNDETERKIKHATSRRETIGNFSGLFVILFVVSISGYLIAIGKGAEGIALILGPLAGIAVLFLATAKSRDKSHTSSAKKQDHPDNK